MKRAFPLVLLMLLLLAGCGGGEEAPTPTVTPQPTPAATATPTGIVSGVTYYVSPSGDDANPGSYEEPWASPGYASKQLQPGDRLIILGGRYHLSTYWDDMITPGSGTEDAWITISGEEGNTPILAGSDDLLAAIELSNTSYVRIENLEITSDPGAPFREGITAWDPASHIVLKDLHIHHVDEMGIDLRDVDDLQIMDCNIHHCGFGAVGGPGGEHGGWRNIVISGCYLSYSGHYYQGGPGPSPYDRPDGFGIEPSQGPLVIVDTLAEHNRGDGLDSKAANTYIRDCIVANNSCDGIKVWGDGSRIENCLIYGTGDGDPSPTPWSALVIDEVETADAHFEIVNTTIHESPQRDGGCPMYAQYASPVPITIVMRNCILAGGQNAVYIGDSVDFAAEHCIFYLPGGEAQVHANARDYSPAQIEGGELGEGNISQDPLFVSPAWGTQGDYHLQPGSPAVDAGTSESAPPTDLDRNLRPQGAGYDIGAYEYLG